MIDILSRNFSTVSSNLLLPVIHYRLFDFAKLELEVVVLAPGCWDSEFKKRKDVSEHTCSTFCYYSSRHGLPSFTLDALNLDGLRKLKLLCLKTPHQMTFNFSFVILSLDLCSP